MIADDNGDHSRRREVSPEDAVKEDLFTFGTVAKISGIQGRRTNEFALVLEGTRRFRIHKVTQTKPFFEARVTFPDEDGTFDRVKLKVNTDFRRSCQRFRSRNTFII